MATRARANARADARYVDASSIGDCARRPATMFTALVELRHVDVRVLANSLRSIVVDPNLLQFVPVGNSSCLILQARGGELVRIVEMLRRIDAAAAEQARHAPPPQDVPQASESER